MRARAGHFSTYRHFRTGHIVWAVVLPIFLPPLVGAIAAACFGWRLTNIPEIIAGTSIFAGFLFALLVFIFQLRIQLSRDSRVQEIASLPRLIDELFYNVLHCSAVAVVFAVFLVCLTVSAPAGDSSTQLGQLESILVTAVGAYLVGLLFVVFSRTRAAYRELTHER